MQNLTVPVRSFLNPLIKSAMAIRDKGQRYEAYAAAKTEAKNKFLSSITDDKLLAKRSKELHRSWKM